MRILLYLLLAPLFVFAQGEQRYADGTATDQDGNTFEWISYGYGENSFHWAIENADVVTYNDGTPIPQMLYPTEWSNLTTGAWCYYNNDPSQHRLYNFYAVNNPKFAPEGWRVASKDDYTLLTDYLENNNYIIEGGIGKAMASTTGWDSSTTAGAPGNDQNSNNRSGFNAFPGLYRSADGSFYSGGTSGRFWTSTPHSYVNSRPTFAYSFSLYYNFNHTTLGASSANIGISVRFVRDAPNDTEPPVFTLLGANPITVNQGDTYTDPGATAFDNVDGDLSSSIVVSGTVDTSTPGTYIVTYSVTDSAGNTSTVTRTVYVVETTPTVDAGSNQTICEGNSVTIYGASASNYSSLQWTTSGDGVLDNLSTINPTYFPGPVDIAAGVVNLVITANGTNGQQVSDEVYITIEQDHQLQINSGNTDQVLCEGESIEPINLTLGGGATGVAITSILGADLSWMNVAVNGTSVTITGTPSEDIVVTTQYAYTIETTGNSCNPATPIEGTITVNPTPKVIYYNNSGSIYQAVCEGNAIDDIVFELEGTQTANVTGLPAGINYTISGTTLTISGTPSSVMQNEIFAYTVEPINPFSGCSGITLSATISVNNCIGNNPTNGNNGDILLNGNVRITSEDALILKSGQDGKCYQLKIINGSIQLLEVNCN